MVQILNSTNQEVDEIFRLYRIATELMKSKKMVYWPDFERSLVETAISENRQWKLVVDGQTACIWTITFDDPEIWEELSSEPAVYIHRIATHPDFRGQNFVRTILSWAKSYGEENEKRFVRMDTVGENQSLIQHYQKCGFEFLGAKVLKNMSALPSHYALGPVCLFQVKIHEN